jgi:N-acetylmuramoyl-L-alanine amidase
MLESHGKVITVFGHTPPKREIRREESEISFLPEIKIVCIKILFVFLLIIAAQIINREQYSGDVHHSASTVMTNPIPAPTAGSEVGSSKTSEISPSALTAETSDWIRVNKASEIRTDPEKSKPVILIAAAGDSFPKLKETGDWLEIQLNNHQTGWIPVNEAVRVKVSKQQIQLIQTKASTKLYWGPDDSLGEAQSIGAGIAMLPEEISGEWIKLGNISAGRPLWIKADEAQWTSGDPPAKEAWSNEVKALSASSAHDPLAHKTIVIDPGHGGSDPGAIAKPIPVYERDINLAAAKVLSEKLKAAGANVILTRTSNDQLVSLGQRANISNDNKADVFVSIHQNMFDKDPSISGTITYFDSTQSKPLAQAIETAVTHELNSIQEKEHVEQEQLYVLKHNERPAVLVEGCFLSNPKELKESLLPDYQEKLAQGIYEGILDYFNVR